MSGDAPEEPVVVVDPLYWPLRFMLWVLIVAFIWAFIVWARWR